MTATSGTANAEVPCPGLVSWVSTVRMELSSATGAADFAEFVQVKGFDWLASYVEGVLNDEPIFELAKTPGRQKSAKDRLSPIKRIALPPISALNFTSAAADLSMISEGDERDAPSLSKSLGGNFITASSTSTVFPKAPVDSNLQPSHDRSLAGGARRELRLSEPESSQPTEAPQAVYPIPDPVSDPTPVKAVNLEPSHSQPPAADQNRAGTDEIAPKDDTAQEDIVESAIRPVVDLSQTTQAAEPEIQMKKTSIEPVTTNRAPESQNIATTAEVASTTGISASSVRPTVSRPSVSQTSRFGKDAVIRTVSISTRLSTHQDVVVPTKQSSPAPGSRTTAPARSSWVQRALGASAGSSAPSRLRKSSFAARAPPASTPETGTSSSSAEVVSSTSGSGLSEDSGDNAEKNAGAGAKRKSDVALNEDGEEDAQESSRTRKTLKLDGDALPPLLGEKQTEPQNSLGRRSPPHLRSTRSIVFKADSGVSKHPHGDGAHEDVPPITSTSPLVSDASGQKAGLSTLTALLGTMQRQREERTVTMTTSSAATTHPASSHTHTRTFSLSELITEPKKESPSSSGSSESYSIDGSSEDEDENETQEIVGTAAVEPLPAASAALHSEKVQDADESSADGDQEEKDDVDIAMKLQPTSFTPPNSPPPLNSGFASRAYSIPDAGSSLLSFPAVPSHSSSSLLTKQPFNGQAMPGPSPISTISTSSSGPSIFSSASAVISSIFSSKPVSLFHGTSQQQSQQHQPTPQALPQSTRDTVLKFNPFAASPKGNREAEHSPPINIKINPFLPSPSPKENRHPSLEPKSTRGTQMPISQSQSTVASSQATGASWFNGSQPSVYSRDSIGEGEGFETDFTQSQPPLESQDKGMHWHDTKPDVKSPAPSDLRVVSATISNNSEVDEAYHFDIGEEDSGMEDPTSGPSEPFVEPTPPSPIASQPPAVPPRVDEGLTVKAKTPKKVPSMYGLSAAMKKKDAEDQKAKAAQDEKRLAKLRRDEDDQTKGAESSQKKEESEKRKREDQPASGKPIKKPEEDVTLPGKKRKLDVDAKPAEKFKPVTKATLKNALSASQLVPQQAGHSRSQSQTRAIATKPSFKPVPSVPSLSSSTVKLVGAKAPESNKSGPSAILTKTAVAMANSASTSSMSAAALHKVPSQTLRAKMHDHLQAQIARERAKAKEEAMEDENIELPDIASEYSNSDEEDAPRYEVAEWADPKKVEEQLDAQGDINPDDIFGPIGTLDMAKVFNAKSSKFRSRTSSANWNGGDALTPAEELEYNRKMGFK